MGRTPANVLACMYECMSVLMYVNMRDYYVC